MCRADGRRPRGMTLIEVLVALAIVAITLAIGLQIVESALLVHLLLLFKRFEARQRLSAHSPIFRKEHPASKRARLIEL